MRIRATAKKRLAVSLPTEVVARLDRTCRSSSRTRSDIVHVAVETYLSKRIPVAEPTAEELRAHKRGMKAIARGEYVTLEQLLHGLARHACPPR